MEFLVASVLLLMLVAAVVARPILYGRAGVEAEAAERADLEAAKQSKYREIRDARLDNEMGKLSDADFRAVDGELRGEAIEILRRLDELDGTAPDSERAGAIVEADARRERDSR